MEEDEEHKKEEEHKEEEHAEETDEEETDVDTELEELYALIDERDAEIERLSTELAELRGKYEEHHTRHHAAQEQRELTEPEPVPEERHLWFKRIGKQ